MTVRFRTGSISSVLAYLLLPVLLLMVWAAPGVAQTAPPASTSQAQAAGGPDPDLRTNVAEPDFTLSALPTTLRLPSRSFSFRLTHRFTRPIAEGDVGDFFADLFGFDSSARIGLELRYGLLPGTQVIVHRTNDRTIQFSGQHEIFPRQAGSGGSYVADAIVAVEGGNNFSEDFSGSVGAVLSRRFQNRGAVYLQPIFVFNAATDLVADDDPQHTFLLGFGARLRLGQSRTYVLFEAAPQVAGYRDGVDHVSFGIEKRAGGHVFQLTITNALGTTLRQIARGGELQGDWFIGFNLSRKFY
jgi:Membrane bound beta barrel domain (DUF5777)